MEIRLLSAPTSWAELGPLLDEALDLAPQEREPWLAQLETTRAEAARELRRLLALDSQLDAQGFLESGPLRQLVATHSLAGQRIGAYTLESPLGEGGMGTVWLAHRSDGRFEGSVAIKLLNVALIGRPSELRFAREGSLLARLQHPNIARLADAGVAENGQPYLVLEYVEGRRVDLHCESLQLDVTARIRLFLDVLAAVAHAHSHLVVHRDLKPPNILVTAAGVVKLLDFGVAALLAEKTDSSDLTREIGQPLTPEYAAPEQLNGSTITTATDVYALGLVLFVLLVGQHPVAKGRKTRAEVLQAVLEREAPLASTVVTDPRLKSELCGDLDNIIGKALKRDPDERYPTASAFADDLKRFLAHEPVQARPDAFAYRAGKFLRRNAVVASASSIAALLLAGTAVFALQQMFEARLQRDNARYETRRAEASSEFMSLVFEEVGPSGTPLSLEQLLDRGVELLERQNGGDPAVLSGMLVQASRRYQDVGRIEKQLHVLERAVALAKTAGAPEVLATALCAGVSSEVNRGKLDAARELLQSASAALAGVRNPAVESQVNCMRASAEILLEQKNEQAALEKLAAARTLLEGAGNTRGLQYTAVLTDMGAVYYRTGRYAEALAMAQVGVEAFQRNGRGGTVGMTIVLGNISTTLYQMGEVLAADARFRENLARETAAHSGPPRGKSASNRGNILLRLEKFDEAQSVLEGGVAMAREDGNRSAENWALIGLARLHTRRGDFAAAERILADLDQYFAAAPDVALDSQRAAAEARIELLLARGDLASARAKADTLLLTINYPRKREVPLLKMLLPTLSRLSMLEGDLTRAQNYAAEALSLTRSVARPGGHSADVGEALLLLCKARQLAGRTEEAQHDIAQAIDDLQASLGPEHTLTREARALRAAL